MTTARVTIDGFATGEASPSWGRFADAADPLAAAATAFVGAKSPRLPRLDRPTLAALVAAHLALEGAAAPASLVVAVEEGSAAADRAFWATARGKGGVEASPMLFAATLPSAVAGELAMTFALRGPCVVVAGPASGGAASALAVPEPCLRVRLRGWDGGGDAFAEVGTPLTSTARPTTHDALRSELVALICDAVRRDPVDPATVTDATPCIGGALLTDSLDVLEVVVAIDRDYGVSLRDGEVGRAVFADMGALTRFVADHRVR